MKEVITVHIPDGFLDFPTVAITYMMLLAYGGYVLRKTRAQIVPERISLVSVLAAAVFAAQMLNWPIPGGTSLHFVGGALAGIMLCPELGFLTMLLVLLVQCLIFHDGGITALGANVLNMAIIDVVAGHLTYRIFIRLFGAKDSVRATAAFLGGWLGLTLAGAAAGLEIGYSSSFPYGVAVTMPVMVGWHAALAVFEGMITALTILYLIHKAPQLVSSETGKIETRRGFSLTSRKALLAILILILISPIFGVILADMVGYHEPLDIAAEVLNLAELTETINWTPLLDYAVPGMPAELGYVIAGLLGIAIILGIYLTLTRLVKRR